MRALLAVAALALIAACAGGSSRDQQSGGAEPGKTGSPRDRARAHTELGVNYYEAGKLAVALEELDTAIKADRSYAPAWNARALVYMDLKEDAKAESDFQQALRIDPGSSETKNNYGLFLCEQKRGKEAIRYFLDAVKDPLYPTPSIAYKNAGQCARKMGDLAAAKGYFQRAVQIDPNQPQALYQLAALNFAGGDAVAAKQYMDRFMRVQPNPGAEELWLGARIEQSLGNRPGVMGYGNQLRRRFPAAQETKAFMQGRFE